jgi:Prophage CP4-57 regulatory protein (AlpA)
MDEHTVVDWKGVKAIGVPYSRTHIWRMMDAGDFPRAFKLGKHRNSHPCGGCAKSSSGCKPTPAARQQLPNGRGGHGVQTVPFPVHTA